MFNDFMSDLKRKEKEERALRREQSKKDFVALLKERDDVVDRHAHWTDVRKDLESEPRSVSGLLNPNIQGGSKRGAGGVMAPLDS